MIVVKSHVKTFAALIKRDFNEYKAPFVWVPLITFSLVLLAMSASLIRSDLFVLGPLSLNDFATGLETMNQRLGENYGRTLTSLYWTLSFSTFIGLPFILLFSMAGALYDERKDRSILFYKSMPVTDWQEVISKLVTIGLLGPILALTTAFATQILLVMSLSVFAFISGADVSLLWPVGDMLSSFSGIQLIMVTLFLWMVPVLAWILLASAFSPKIPFAFAALPVVVISLLEYQLMGTKTVLNFFINHSGSVILSSIFNSVDGTESLPMFDIASAFSILVDSFKDTKLWLGLGIGGVFLFLAAMVRRRSL